MRGREIQDRIISAGLTQSFVAEKVGISEPLLSAIMTEKVKASDETMEKLERLLKLADLFEKICNITLKILKEK